MFAQQINPKLLARLRKPKHPIQRDNIREDPPSLVIMYHIQELECHVFARSIRESPISCGRAETVQFLVLMMQSFVKDRTSYTRSFEHASDKGFEIDITVVELGGDWPTELNLICLEAGG